MIAPDDGLEDALRQALSAAASQVEPADGGLERILVRTGGTAPRSWLASMAAEGLRRTRHWVWRGHWAWQDPGFWQARYQVLQDPLADWRGRARGTRPSAWLAGAWAGAASLATGSAVHDALSLRSHGRLWVRLAAGFAAAACITAVTVSDPPLRAALAQVSATVLTGANGGLQPGVGGGGAASATGAQSTSASGSAGTRGGTLPPSARPGSASSPAPCPTASAAIGTLRAAASPSATPSGIAPTSVPSAASATAAPTSCPTASGGATVQPTAPSTPTPAAPTTQAPTTAPPATAPPTTAPPTTAPPTTPPTDTATPTQTPSAASSAGTEGTATGGSPSGTTPNPAP
jgi:hypothetical protein